MQNDHACLIGNFGGHKSNTENVTAGSSAKHLYLVITNDMNDREVWGFCRVEATNPQEAEACVNGYGQMPGHDYRVVSVEEVVEKRYLVTMESMCSTNQTCIEITAANPKEAMFIADDFVSDNEYRAIRAEEVTE